VHEHGTPPVDDPARLDGVGRLGLDETSFLKATRLAPTRYVTGLVDLEQGRLLDVVADRTRAAVHSWLDAVRVHLHMSFGVRLDVSFQQGRSSAVVVRAPSFGR
jgi:hypothetical protein